MDCSCLKLEDGNAGAIGRDVEAIAVLRIADIKPSELTAGGPSLGREP
jgi:hypothetical protein